MAKLSSQQVAGYIHKSYKAVDGLWFRNFEKRFGFGIAARATTQNAAKWTLFKVNLKKLGRLFVNLETFHESIFFIDFSRSCQL